MLTRFIVGSIKPAEKSCAGVAGGKCSNNTSSSYFKISGNITGYTYVHVHTDKRLYIQICTQMYT